MTRPSSERIKDINHRIEQVRQVLLSDWDPLAIGGNPNLADEYDAYLGRVLTTLDNAPCLESLAAVLAEAEADLGVGSAPDHQGRWIAALHLLELSRA